jgi:hypothetical protein
MSAYNWINIKEECPSCHKTACIKCQTHVASNFYGDGIGRFCHREYNLDDKMSWWPENDKRFMVWRADWLENNVNLPSHQAVEACYSQCENCKAGLCVVIQFDSLRPTQVVHINLESDWPENYSA